MPTPSACACGSTWERINRRDGLGPVWTVRHVGGREACRGLPPPKPSELLEGREPTWWNPAVGTGYMHSCGTELLVRDLLGDGKLELQCMCDAAPVELAVELGIPLRRLRHHEIGISIDMLKERGGTDPGTLSLLALLEQGRRAVRG